MANGLVSYFKEARAELLKVNWPTKEQVKNYTVLVIVLSAVTAVFLGGLDALFGLALRTFVL